MSTVERELERRIAELGPDEKRRVLEFTRSIGPRAKRGTSGAALLRFAGRIPKDDVRRIREAIEEGCERVDADGW